MKKELLNKFKKHRFFIYSIFIVVLIGAFLRFYNYHNRWGLAYDQAQFSVVSRYALETLQIPLLGPFSSGGPFQTGGEWYWVVMLGILTYPWSILSPWIFLTVTTLVAIVIMIYVGKVYKNKVFGIILGVLTAVSPIQIYQSTNLTNQTPIILISSLALLFGILYIRRKKSLFFFLLVLSVGIGTSIHIQSVALIPFVVATYLLFSRRYLLNLLLMVLGIALPWLPVLIADYNHDFYNTKAILTYFSSGQASVSYEALGRRWLTFITDFIPSAWGQIIGIGRLGGYIAIVFTGLIVLRLIIKKKLNKELILLCISIALMFTVLRYVRTPLFESFYIFIHPFVIFFSGFTIYSIFRWNRAIGVMVITAIFASSILTVWRPISIATNETAKKSIFMQKELGKKHSFQKYAVYDYQYESRGTSLPLVMYLMQDGQIDDEGKKIGIRYASSSADFAQIEELVLIGSPHAHVILDLSKMTAAELSKDWVFVNPSEVYDSVVNWYKK